MMHGMSALRVEDNLSNFLLSQILAAIAFALGLAAYHFKPRHQVLKCLFASTVFNAVHFLALGRPGPAVLVILTGIRYVTATFTTSSRWMYFFFCASTASFFLVYKSPLSLLGLGATLIGTYGSFRPSDRALRIYLMVGTSMWLIHNILASTPVAAMMEASFLASNVLSYRKLYHTNRDSISPQERCK